MTASDIDVGQELTYSASGLPAGATFDPATRTFTWTPASEQVRTEPYNVTFTVTDNGEPALSAETSIDITVDRGAYITGPSSAVEIGDLVELEYHGEYQSDPWHVQWDHDGTVLPEQNDELLVIDSVEMVDAGWYAATQISDTKADPISASYELRVVEAMPLRWWVVLAVVASLIAHAGLRKRMKPMQPMKRKNQRF